MTAYDTLTLIVETVIVTMFATIWVLHATGALK